MANPNYVYCGETSVPNRQIPFPTVGTTSFRGGEQQQNFVNGGHRTHHYQCDYFAGHRFPGLVGAETMKLPSNCVKDREAENGGGIHDADIITKQVDMTRKNTKLTSEQVETLERSFQEDIELEQQHAAVIKTLEKKMRNFLWEHKEGAKTSHLVNWDLVQATKEKGGLGVCNLRVRNLALLAKWCWRFGVEKNKLWYKIVAAKYGSDFSNWIPGNINQTYGVSCWCGIAETASLVSENSTLFVHSGNIIAFWNDIWCGQVPLAFVSPNLYKLSRNFNATLADMVSSEGNWMFDFKRALTNREVEEYAILIDIIGNVPPVQDTMPDTRRWKLNTSGLFTVKSLYVKLIANSGVNNFPSQFNWKPAIPPKINILMWCLLHGKLNTIDVLQRKGMDLYNSCVLCGVGVETQDHLFLHRRIAYKIWSGLLPNTGWTWVFPNSMISLANMWHHNNFSGSGNYIWGLIPAGIINTIWRERNYRRFEENYLYKTDDDLIQEVKSSVLCWAAAAGHRVHLNFSHSVLSTWDSIF